MKTPTSLGGGGGGFRIECLGLTCWEPINPRVGASFSRDAGWISEVGPEESRRTMLATHGLYMGYIFISSVGLTVGSHLQYFHSSEAEEDLGGGGG